MAKSARIGFWAAATLFVAVAANASPIQERDVECADILPSMNADLAAATRFCTIYLQIIPETTTATQTQTRVTRTTNEPEYTTATSFVTPAALESSVIETSTTSTTVTPGTTTVTAVKTSTEYLDPDGSTIAIVKRATEPSPVDLAPRAIVTPSYLKGLKKTDIRAACACLGLSTPTYTRAMTVGATATVTKTLSRTLKTTTTLAAVVTATTVTTTREVTVTAPAPRSTTTTWTTQQISGCPPSTTSNWLCPDQTGDDDGSHDNQLSCSTIAFDGFSGYCLYWDDDGSPAASTLIRGDGSGDPDYNWTREAIYGDADTDDCPSWADWTCSASGGGRKRSTIERLSDEHKFRKRGYKPKKISLAEHRRVGKKVMPKGLRRGGKYRKTVEYHKVVGKSRKAGET